MGREKVMLPFGVNESLLQRVVRLVGEAVPFDRIVCISAAHSSLPPLPAAVRVICDPVPHLGPLAGLVTGLSVCADFADAVYLTGCDTPHLLPKFVARMFSLLGDQQIAAPHDGERFHPLAAVYRTSVFASADALLAAGERRLVALLESSGTRRVLLDELRDVDLELQSLAACNTPSDYEAALRRKVES